MCTATAIASTSLVAFYIALFLLGVGWNLMIVCGTTLFSQSYRPSERPKTQALGGLLANIAGSTAALSSGLALATIGWAALNLFMLPILVFCIVMILRWARSRGAPGAALA